MIVENELIIAISLKLTLEANNFKVCNLATSWCEAISSLRSEKPDILLLDIYFNSNNDGIDVSEYVNAEFSEIKLIFITGCDYYTQKERLENLKYEDYLEKPIDMKLLLDKLNALC